jgi:Domain of Unknown Function (DUF928).
MMNKNRLHLTTLSLVLVLEPMMMANLPATATQQTLLAKPQVTQANLVALQRRMRFRVPGVRPSYNLGTGAARGNCNADDTGKIDVVALMPNTNMGLTVAEKPTVFFRVSKTSVQEAKFNLLNEKGNTIIYDKTIPLNNTGDVMSFTLPADAPALEVGKEYQWELVINCDPDDPNGNPRVQSAIKRVQPSPTLVSKLAQANPSDRPFLYAEEGIWIDALSTLAKLRVANPNNSELKEEWTTLLTSAGLQELATAPLIGSVP